MWIRIGEVEVEQSKVRVVGIEVGGVEGGRLLRLFRPLRLPGLLMLMLLVTNFEVLSGLFHFLIICKVCLKSEDVILDASRKALVVVVFENCVGVVEFGHMLVELCVVLNNFLDTLNCLFYVGYRVNVIIIFLKYLKKLRVVIILLALTYFLSYLSLKILNLKV